MVKKVDKEDLVDGKSKQTEKIEPKVIEEQVVGKVALYIKKKKFGSIKRNDAKDGDKEIFFLGKKDIGIPGLELKFDVIEREKGTRNRAVNIEVLKTAENEALKVEWEKLKDLVGGKSKHTEEIESKVIEEKVVGKVALFLNKRKYGFIKRNDAKEGDKEIFFFGHQDIGLTGLEVKFDVVEREKGTRAVNVEMLETQENEALKVEWQKLNPIKLKEDLVNGKSKHTEEIESKVIEEQVAPKRKMVENKAKSVKNTSFAGEELTDSTPSKKKKIKYVGDDSISQPKSSKKAKKLMN